MRKLLVILLGSLAGLLAGPAAAASASTSFDLNHCAGSITATPYMIGTNLVDAEWEIHVSSGGACPSTPGGPPTFSSWVKFRMNGCKMGSDQVCDADESVLSTTVEYHWADTPSMYGDIGAGLDFTSSVFYGYWVTWTGYYYPGSGCCLVAFSGGQTAADAFKVKRRWFS